jgi:hypothetical protein
MIIQAAIFGTRLETLLRRSSDAVFRASGAHVLYVRCAPVLENHALCLAAATFETVPDDRRL